MTWKYFAANNNKAEKQNYKIQIRVKFYYFLNKLVK